MTTTEAQIKAMQESFLPGNLAGDEAREAIDAAREALEQGLLPLLAVNAACSKLYTGFAVMSQEARGVLMVETLNGLMAADAVERIGPKGVLPIQVIRTKSRKRR